jgi:DNA-binding beta-propeller fold protein YncE
MHSRKVIGCAACLIVVLLNGVWGVAQGTQFGPPELSSAPPSRSGDYLYVAVPGTAESQNGVGVLVFDVKNHFRFVKRIPTLEYATWQDPADDEVKGFIVSPEAGKMYLGLLHSGLLAIDLVTEKVAWKVSPPDGCCDRIAITPDGKTIYAPNRGGTGKGWLVVDAQTGEVVTRINPPKTVGAHNTVVSADGAHVFMSSTQSVYISVVDPKTDAVVQAVGPFGGKDLTPSTPRGADGRHPIGGVRPFTVNGRGTLLFANVNGLLGYEVGDVRTGKIISHNEVKNYAWSPERLRGEFTPSHGIALSPDEREVWVTDNPNTALHVFDVTVIPNKQKISVELPNTVEPGETRVLAGPYWVCFGLDGKYVFSSTGHVIYAATKQIVTLLRDEYGRPVRSEKESEVLFVNGKATKATDQMGKGLVTGSETN